MLLAALFVGLLQHPPPSGPTVPLTHEATAPALAAKAPGAPGYGLQVTTSAGKVMVTSLSYHPDTHKVGARLYRIVGPAGLGPYRLGIERGLMFQPKQEISDTREHPSWFDNHFYCWNADDGSPAKEAGLDRREGWVIEGVDDNNFGWDLNALLWHITNRPIVAVNAFRARFVGNIKRKTFRIITRRLEAPVDPGDGAFQPIQAEGEAKAWLADKKTWRDLLILRSSRDLFAPLVLTLADRKLWVVRTLNDSSPDGSSKAARVLEFWKEDPLSGAFDSGLIGLWPEPEDGLLPDRILRIEDRWYRIQDCIQDSATGRLLTLDLRPWAADVPSLLIGTSPAKELGPMKAPLLREDLEQQANDALLEWKTRILPGLLRTQEIHAMEDLVIRAEKGLLTLDLEVKGIRSRLDAAARAEAERKAQAELAARDGKAPPQALIGPATE
ncbi:MAG: hypothetical protein Q8K67_09935, partial [Geothrix sp.]|nr:hypothetical protein [Geothrix sp.]